MSDDNFGFPKPAGPINETPEAGPAGFLAYVPVSGEENDVTAVPIEIWLDRPGNLNVIVPPEQTDYLKGLLVSGKLSGVYFFEERTAKEDVGIQKELQHLLNRYSAESPSGTPDFILAEFLIETLKVFNEAVSKRAQWRDEPIDQR